MKIAGIWFTVLACAAALCELSSADNEWHLNRSGENRRYLEENERDYLNQYIVVYRDTVKDPEVKTNSLISRIRGKGFGSTLALQTFRYVVKGAIIGKIFSKSVLDFLREDDEVEIISRVSESPFSIGMPSRF